MPDLQLGRRAGYMRGGPARHPPGALRHRASGREGVNPGRRRPPGGDRARRGRPAGCRRRRRRLIAVAAPEFRDRLAV